MYRVNYFCFQKYPKRLTKLYDVTTKRCIAEAHTYEQRRALGKSFDLPRSRGSCLYLIHTCGNGGRSASIIATNVHKGLIRFCPNGGFET